MDKLKKEINSAVDIFKSGNLSKAEQITRKLIEENPKEVFLYNLMGLILSKRDKTNEAISFYEKGIKVNTNYAMNYNNLGILLFYKGSKENYLKAEKLYKKSIELNNKMLEPYINLGNLYKTQNKFEDSIKIYEEGIKINPKFYLSHHNIGNTYIAIGNFDKAKKHYKEAVKLNPYFYKAHRALSRVTKYSAVNKHFKQLKEIYMKIDINDHENLSEVAFALAKAYEDIEDFDNSFKYYKKANNYYGKKYPYSSSKQIKKFNRVKEIYSNKLLENYKDSGVKDFSPIFIVGMPRSGTTLVEQILSSHPKVFGGDELRFIPNIKKLFNEENFKSFTREKVNLNSKLIKKYGKQYINEMNELSSNFKRTTDKLPTNFFSIGFIKLILPKSKIVHCCRSPEDNCLSIYKTHFTSNKVRFSYNLKDTVEYYNLYKDLMKYWNNLLPNFIFNISYEDLISNTRNKVSELLNFCDLEWSENCLNFYANKRPIRTASDIQARSKIYNSSIKSWKKFDKYLSESFSKLKK